MKLQDFNKLKKGDIVVCKKTKEKFIFDKFIRAWDVVLSDFSFRREHMEAQCIDSKGNFKYFESRDIIKC